MKTAVVDITHIPFSRYGAYISVTRNEGKEGEPDARELIIHSMRQRFQDGPLFSLKFGSGEPEDFKCHANPDALYIENENGKAVIWIRDDESLAVESEGLDLTFRLMHYGYGTENGERNFRIISGTLSQYSEFRVENGISVLDGPMEDYWGGKINRKTILKVGCEDGRALVGLRVGYGEPGEVVLPICREKEIAAVAAEWEAFLEKMPDSVSIDENTDNFVLVTWYNLWSCFVRAKGCYTADTMLMAKKHMNSTWSWDHCFNALAMAKIKDRNVAKKIALEQFSAPFVLQREKGVLPDMWNPDLEIRWGTTKPPIHGWCFSLLMDRFDFTKEELETAYDRLVKWTGWWMNYSDTDHDGIPDYPQGCDSGWDNGTLFDIGNFVETPDLPAFLILQMRTLAGISAKLGNPENEQYWIGESEALMKRFIAHSWNGEKFISKLSNSHVYDENPTCLLAYMPIVLGDLLPKEITDKLAYALENSFLTENGLATEMPSSPKYDPDGYWRGPIWAPTTYLMVDGLRRAGYDKLARTVAERYCNMSANKAKGNYENFDALTGKGRRAPGYTWATSVYMMLHLEYGC